jgi:peptide/nickel transport system permease protein
LDSASLKTKPTFKLPFGLQSRQVKDFWAQYRQSKLALIGIIVIAFYLVLAITAPIIAPYNPFTPSVDVLATPTMSHLLGTSEVGNDILSQVIYGAKVSLLVGFVAASVSLLIGTSFGLVSGYYGGAVDAILTRVTDIFLVIPVLPLMIIMAAVLGARLSNVILVVGLLGWPSTSRIVRSQTLSIRERPFIENARTIGSNDRQIIFKHILPNVVTLIFANAVLVVNYAVISEAILSFLGLGDVSQISWGIMLYYAFRSGALSSGAWWYVFPPGLCLVSLVLSFAFVGRALDAIFNPRLRKIR